MELKKLGIFGCEAIQDLISAAILTGDPALLIAGAGTAKTYAIQRIAEALGLEFRMYNCSSANFDDIIGFPSIRKDEDGKKSMEYISVPTSIWGTELLFLDELSRCRLDVQNLYFTLIRNRSVQGQKVETLKMVFAAMNPLSYAGVTPLDSALADRFAWTIKMPSFTVINEEDRHRIISNHTSDDCPAITHWGGVKHTHTDIELRNDLRQWFQLAARIYQRYLSDCHDVVAYVDDVCASISSSGRASGGPIEGRRAGILLRNILSLAAVREAYGLNGGFEAAASKALYHSFPNEAVDDGIPGEVIIAAHEKAKHLLRQQASSVLERIERLPDTLLKVAHGIRCKIEPVVLGGYVMQYIEEHKHDYAAMVAFAYATWPYLRYANITSDALTQVAKILSVSCSLNLKNLVTSNVSLQSNHWSVSALREAIDNANKEMQKGPIDAFCDRFGSSQFSGLSRVFGDDVYRLGSLNRFDRYSFNSQVESNQEFKARIKNEARMMMLILSDGGKFKPEALMEDR